MKARIFYAVIILIGTIGLALVFVWTIAGESNPLQWGIAILSMFLMLIGFSCYNEEGGKI